MSSGAPSSKGRRYDERRGSSTQRGYGSKWQTARRQYLDQNPLCVRCTEMGHVTPATVVDHIKAHKGDPKLFWDRKNWQSLCKPHHDQDKQREERLGYRPGVTTDGRPVDPSHPWNAR